MTTISNGEDGASVRAKLNAALAVTDVTSGINTGDQTSVSGNAGTATALQTSRNFSITGGGITAAAVGFTGAANVVLSASVDSGHITLARMADVATATVFYRKTAGAGAPEVQTLATLKTDLGLTGTNSGDQTSIVGITGTKAQFDTAVTDGNILYVGDITQYTDELAQDAVGGILTDSAEIDFTYDDATPSITAAIVAGSIDESKLDASVNASLDLADSASQPGHTHPYQPLDTQLTDLAGLAYTANALKVVRVNAGETAWELATIGALTDGDKGDITVSASGATWTIDSGVISLTKMADVATGTVFYRKTAGTGAPEVQTLATLKTDLGLTGTNSGDQTSIVGISGTKAEFDTACSDGNFLYSGDVTQYTDEMAQDAVGGMVDGSLTYVDGTPLLQRAALTGDVTASAGSNVTSIANDAVVTAKILNNNVTLAKLATIATDSILGRATAATGDVEVLTALPFAFTGDVTRPADSNAQTIANDAVTYAKMQNVSATDKILGRSSAGAGDVEEITCTATGRSILDDTSTAAVRATIGLDVASITFVIDGGGATITTGVKGDLTIPFACTITEWTLLADQSGSIQLDIWKDTYANYPPTVADTITASAKPLFSSTTKGQSSTLTGWTTSIAAGDTLRFNVDSITTCQRVTLSLKVTR